MSYKRNFTRYKNRNREINRIVNILKTFNINYFAEGGRTKHLYSSDVLSIIAKKWDELGDKQ